MSDISAVADRAADAAARIQQDNVKKDREAAAVAAAEARTVPPADANRGQNVDVSA